jgi:hypothetical protein
MKQDFIDAVIKTKEELNQYTYGFKNLFLHSIDEDNLFLKIPGINVLNEFDCVHYAIKGQELLMKRGVSTSVYSGKDVFGIWKVHTFLKTGDKIIDFTPIYPLFGANHPFPEHKLLEEEIDLYKNEHLIPLNNMLPFHFDTEENTMLRIGIKTVSFNGFVRYNMPLIEAYIDIAVRKNNKCELKGPLIIEKKSSYEKTGLSFFDTGFLSLSPLSKDIPFILEKSKGLEGYLLPFLSRVL